MEVTLSVVGKLGSRGKRVIVRLVAIDEGGRRMVARYNGLSRPITRIARESLVPDLVADYKIGMAEAIELANSGLSACGASEISMPRGVVTC